MRANYWKHTCIFCLAYLQNIPITWHMLVSIQGTLLGGLFFEGKGWLQARLLILLKSMIKLKYHFFTNLGDQLWNPTDLEATHFFKLNCDKVSEFQMQRIWIEFHTDWKFWWCHIRLPWYIGNHLLSPTFGGILNFGLGMREQLNRLKMGACRMDRRQIWGGGLLNRFSFFSFFDKNVAFRIDFWPKWGFLNCILANF